MEELLASLESVEDSEVLRVACGWIRENSLLWSSWAMPREVPFYADSLLTSYPFPMLILLLLTALLWMACVEKWLSTTLSFREWRRVLRENNAVWRSDVELKLRKSLPERSKSKRASKTLRGYGNSDRKM